MILESLFNLFFGLFNVAFSLLPVFELPDSGVAAISSFFSYSSLVFLLIPVDTFKILFPLALTIYFIDFVISFLMFFLKKIPGVN
jgi:hypothetical protein